jgi:hypothetical protein
MATSIVLDPRFPIPDSLSKNDPSHPLQLVKTATMVQNQAAADTKYDLPVPERFRQGKKEGFRSPFDGPGDFAIAIGLLIFMIFVWISVRNSTRTLYPLILLLGFAALFLVYKKAFV